MNSHHLLASFLVSKEGERERKIERDIYRNRGNFWGLEIIPSPSL
jgi:hypothetical protein